MTNVNSKEFFKLEKFFIDSSRDQSDGFSIFIGTTHSISFNKWNNNAFKFFIENIKMSNYVCFDFNIEECSNESLIYIDNLKILKVKTWDNKRQLLNCTELVITDHIINNMENLYNSIESYQKKKNDFIQNLIKEINDKNSNSSIKTNRSITKPLM